MNFIGPSEIIITRSLSENYVIYLAPDLSINNWNFLASRLQFLLKPEKKIGLIISDENELSGDHFFPKSPRHLISNSGNLDIEEICSFLEQEKCDIIVVIGFDLDRLSELSVILNHKSTTATLEIDLDAIDGNIGELKSYMPSSTKVMCMVKANAYGSGIDLMSEFLAENHCDYLGVANADEGMEIRRNGIDKPILLLTSESREFQKIVENNLEPTMYSLEIINAFSDFLNKQEIHNYPIHIELDTGMNRLGFKEQDLKGLREVLIGNSAISVKSIFSHFTSSEDVSDLDFTNLQLKKYEDWFDYITQVLPYPVMKHIQNSHGVLALPKAKMDLARLGISMYGYTSQEYKNPRIQHAHRLSAKILQIKNVEAGETIGYNRKTKINSKGQIGIVQIGYGDGIPRLTGNRNYRVKINEHLYPIVGNVCMDLLMIDLGDRGEVEVGDSAVFFDRGLDISLLADAAQTSVYEIITQLSARINRIYKLKTSPPNQ